MKIFLDVHVSDYAAGHLRGDGHDVWQAEISEFDKAFFKRTEEITPHLVVSADYDWMNHYLDRGIRFLHLQQGWSKRKVLREIKRALKKIRGKSKALCF